MNFQKLLTSATPRVSLISSYTTLTSGAAASYSMGFNWLISSLSGDGFRQLRLVVSEDGASRSAGFNQLSRPSSAVENFETGCLRAYDASSVRRGSRVRLSRLLRGFDLTADFA